MGSASALGTLPETLPLTRVAAQAIVRVPATDPFVEFATTGLGMKTLRSSIAADGNRVTVRRSRALCGSW